MKGWQQWRQHFIRPPPVCPSYHKTCKFMVPQRYFHYLSFQICLETHLPDSLPQDFLVGESAWALMNGTFLNEWKEMAMVYWQASKQAFSLTKSSKSVKTAVLLSYFMMASFHPACTCWSCNFQYNITHNASNIITITYCRELCQNLVYWQKS